MLKPRSFSRTCAVALLIWIAGVVIIRFTGDYILVDGLGFIIGFAGAAIAGPPTVWIAARLTGFAIKDMVAPTMVIAMLALTLDGLSMGFMPDIYVNVEKIRFLAPLFLWAFGWACLSAYLMASYVSRSLVGMES